MNNFFIFNCHVRFLLWEVRAIKSQIFSSTLIVCGLLACSNITSLKKNNTNCDSKQLMGDGQVYGSGNRQILGGTPTTSLTDLRTTSTVYMQVTLSTNRVAACGAVLVAPNTVVTASHCLTPPPAMGSVYSVDLYFSPSLKSGIPSIKATSFTTHPKYPENYEVNGVPQTAADENGQLVTITTPNYDIAVVQFTSPLPASYKPIPVWTDLSKLKSNDTVWLAGWGQTADNGPTSRTLLSVDSIFTRMANTQAKDPPSEGIMVIGPKANKGACHGDSGGPLHVLGKDNGGKEHWFAAGVTQGFNTLYFPNVKADGTDCELGASLYTAIAHYKDWIEGTAGIKLTTQADVGVTDIIRNPTTPTAAQAPCIMPTGIF